MDGLSKPYALLIAIIKRLLSLSYKAKYTLIHGRDEGLVVCRIGSGFSLYRPVAAGGIGWGAQWSLQAHAA